jgi:hypothetical protein
MKIGFLLKLVAISVAIVSVAAHAQKLQPIRQEPQIYLVRGFMDVFSTGLDQLADKLRSHGYGNVHVVGLQGVTSTVRQLSSTAPIGARSPIVLIGHSLGANAVIDIARRLNEASIPIQLLVTFDATEALPVPGNVARLVNFYQRNGVGRLPTFAPDFRGTFYNLDLSTISDVTHTNIDKLNRLHLIVIEEVGAITMKRRSLLLQLEWPPFCEVDAAAIALSRMPIACIRSATTVP